MKAELKIKKDGELVAVKLHNTLTFDQRLDEELDGGAAAALNNNSEEMAEFNEALLTLTDETGELTIPFYAFDDVQKRANGYYLHSLELVEPTRLLMGITIDGLKITQPIDESAQKKTLLDVAKRVLRCYKTHLYSEVVQNNVAGYPSFKIDENVEDLLSSVISPEFEWQAQTLLFEVLQDIADVINCIPRLTVDENGEFLTITFDKVNDVPAEYEL